MLTRRTFLTGMLVTVATPALANIIPEPLTTEPTSGVFASVPLGSTEAEFKPRALRPEQQAIIDNLKDMFYAHCEESMWEFPLVAGEKFHRKADDYLKSRVKGDRVLYDYKVVADQVVMTPEMVDSGVLAVQVYLKFSLSLSFHRINMAFDPTNTGLGAKFVNGWV